MRRIIFFLALLVPGAAAADGVISVRHAYYKERSTRVQQPMIDAGFDTRGGRFEGHFLVDSITSASAASGAGPTEFNERRYEVGLGYTQDLPAHVKAGGLVKYSTELDYTSIFGALHGEIALREQTTTLRLLLGAGADAISNQAALENAAPGAQVIDEHMSTLMASAGVTQVLAPRAVASLTYDFIRLSGYQANPYRLVGGGSQFKLERVPDLRLRQAIAVGLRGYLPSRTTAILSYRLYIDDWGILAHTPEVRLVQTIVDGLDVRLRYRFSTQSEAEFYKAVYNETELLDETVSVTDDQKLSSFRTHTFGGQISMALSVIGMRGKLGNIRGDAVVERILQTTSFGDAWTAQVGLTIPFEY